MKKAIEAGREAYRAGACAQAVRFGVLAARGTIS